VGKSIMRSLAGTDKRLTLELGGKAANIVFDDAPVDEAVEGVVNGIYFNQDVTIRPGMSCDVELVKDSYDKVMYVPVQCVVRENGMPILYVRRNGVWTAQMVRVGFDNNRMIRIIDGVKVGEEVMMAPPIKESKSEDKESLQMEEARRRMKARTQEEDALDQPPPLKSKKRKPVVKEDDPSETKTPGSGETKTEVHGDSKTEAHHEKKNDTSTVGILGTSTKETGT
jgi:hypothetical protein